MSNWRFGIVVVVLIGKPPLMGEVLCSTENTPFLIIDHIHANINFVLGLLWLKRKLYESKEKYIMMN